MPRSRLLVLAGATPSARARLALPTALSLLALLVVAAPAADRPELPDQPRAELLAADHAGLRARIPAAADADADGAWHGLVAVPPGKRPVLAAGAGGADLGAMAVMHGVRLAPLTVPGGGATVDVAFVDDPGAPVRTTIAESFGNLLEAATLGGAQVRAQYEESLGTYLMICPIGATAAVEPLLQWRREQGYHVIRATTLQAGSTTASIRAYIQQVYDTADPPLAHVCLVGDATGSVSLPTWRESVSGYNGEGDHAYTRLDGDDVLADVHIGRLTCRTLDELEGIVAKILAYEREPDLFTDPSWFGRAVLAGDPSSSGTSTIYVNQWLKEQLQPLGYTQIDTIWTAPFASQIFQKLNRGASVYSYRGYLGCSGFSPSYIDNLTNGTELPFAIMVTCASGSFASDTHGYSEAMLRNPGGGAIGAVGTATIGTHTRYNNCYFHGAWEGALNEPDRALGYAHTRGKLELYLQYQANEPDVVEIWSVWNNLMGDPATEMRQAWARTASATHPAAIPAAAEVVPVSVTVDGAPRAGARVAIFQEGLAPVAATTDVSGEVLLPLPAGVQPGEVAVTVTGDDLFPHRGTVLLGDVDAHCAAVAWSWDDGTDGMPDPGETGALSVTLRNLGQQLAPAVTADLVARTDGVTVAGPAFAVGDLAAGAEAVAGPWTVTLPGDLPDGTDAILALDAADATDAWRSRVALPLQAPRFAVAATDWTGQPGQTSELRLTLENVGSVGAVGATASLTLGGGYLLAAGPLTVDLGAVAASGTAEAAYLLTAVDDAWGGHLAPCRLTVATAAGTVQEIELPVAIGGADADSPVGPGTLGYLAWDDGDPAAEAPAYQWREIDPSRGGLGEDVGLTDFAYEGDDTRTVDLPFTFRFRGRDYDRISICSNGWVSLGQTYLVHWRNWGLPAAGAPDPLLAVFWDDLVQVGTDRVYHRHDAAAGLYIVQWSGMRNRYGGLQTCQILLHDPAQHPTPTGDGLIVYQYQQVNNNDTGRGYATVGLQDGQDGVTYTYYDDYPTGARTLAAGRAIAWVPAPPALAATAQVSPAALDVTLAPDAQQTLELSVQSVGPAGAMLRWQVSLTEVRAAGKADDAGGAGDDPLLVRTLEMLVPNGGESWQVDEVHDIRWDAGDEVQAVRLQIDRGDGWQTLASNLPAAGGSWSWTVTGPASNQCRMRVVDAQDILLSDASDGTFMVTADFPWLSVSPRAGQTPAGEVATITVALDATGLEPGTYAADLVLQTSGEPISVPIRLEVGDATGAAAVPTTVSLAPNAPNPFNPRTVITFALPRAAETRLTVHDLRGRRVRTLVAGELPAGTHQAVFDAIGDDGAPLASGTYVYRLQAAGEVLSRRLTLVK
jgi:hypothetical protein